MQVFSLRMGCRAGALAIKLYLEKEHFRGIEKVGRCTNNHLQINLF